MCNQNQVNYDRDPDKNIEKSSSETAFTVVFASLLSKTSM